MKRTGHLPPQPVQPVRSASDQNVYRSANCITRGFVSVREYFPNEPEFVKSSEIETSLSREPGTPTPARGALGSRNPLLLGDGDELICFHVLYALLRSGRPAYGDFIR